MSTNSPTIINDNPESRGAGFAALWITVQIVITAAVAVGTLWMSPGLAQTLGEALARLNGRAAPEPNWIASLTTFWASLVGVATALLIGTILVRWTRMLTVATLWSMTVAILAVMSTVEFGFEWVTIPILASSAVLVLAVRQHTSRAA